MFGIGTFKALACTASNELQPELLMAVISRALALLYMLV